jgi:murein DD-endopeptidase MepM/ murein hydrolase activator NlpD
MNSLHPEISRPRPPCRLEPLEPRLLLNRPDPNPAENVLFRLPLSSDTSVHYYFDRDPGPGVLAWNGTTQSYNGHRGTDYSGGPRNRPVYAIAPGILIAKDDGHPDFGGPANGNYVRINHGNDRNALPINSVYLHFNAGSVTTKPIGSFIASGEQVGGVGTSGNSTGLHLHLETQLNRVAFDPYRANGSSEVSWWVNQGSGAPSTQSLPYKLVSGDIAEVYELGASNLNVRSPNPTSGAIGSLPNGSTGVVLEGPVWSAFSNDWNNNLWVWYRVRWDNGLEGWSAQNWLRKFVDTIPPTVQQSEFVYQTAPHQLTYRFSEDVGASLQPSDLVVRNLQTQAQVLVAGVSFDPSTYTATFTLNGIVPDGAYRATLSGGGVSDPAGNPMGQDHHLDFWFLQGDANRDGRVNLADFNIVAANFGQPNRTFAQGDFNYDGVVNLQDFNILAGRFGTVLAASTTRGGANSYGSPFGSVHILEPTAGGSSFTDGRPDAEEDPVGDLLA